MNDVSLPVDEAAAARSGLLRLHEAVQQREPGCPDAELSGIM